MAIPLRLFLPASSAALLALAFVAAPHSCAWGLATYFWTGVVLIVGNAVATFALLRGRTTARRVLLAGLAALVVGSVWLAGLFAANFQLLCRLF
ncbi:MAG: hypothetical protein C3F19_07720 [Rhodocyclales bacterium]|nr:MAG: hypothetical protein C3F19_07720 [Rhodocyclales bacterium]